MCVLFCPQRATPAVRRVMEVLGRRALLVPKGTRYTMDVASLLVLGDSTSRTTASVQVHSYTM